MKVVLEVDTKNLKPNDILIYKDKKWTNVSKESFLKSHLEQIEKFKIETTKRLEENQKQINTMAKAIKTLLGE